MEEIIVALIIVLYQLIAVGTKKAREWRLRRRERAAAEEARRRVSPSRGAPAEAPSRAEDPLAARKEVLRRALDTMDRRARASAKAMRRTVANAPLAEVIDGAVTAKLEPLELTLRATLPDASPAAQMDLARLERQLGVLQRLLETLEAIGRDREDSRHRGLIEAVDAVARDCYRPLTAWAQRYEIPLTSRSPVGFVGVRGVDPSIFVPTVVAAIPLPPRVSDDLSAWALVPFQIGRDFLESVRGLKWELRTIFGLPDKHPVPYAFRGYIGEDEVVHPFGVWIEMLFADLLASASTGPAYAEALIAGLGDAEQPTRTVAVGVTNSGVLYAPAPPAHLRVFIAARTLAATGHAERSRALWQRWTEMHRQDSLFLPTRIGQWVHAPLSYFEGMVDRIVSLVLFEPLQALNGQRLIHASEFVFGPERQAEAERWAETLVAGGGYPPGGRLALVAALIAREQAPIRERGLLQGLVRAFGGREQRRRTVAGPAPAAAAKAEGDERIDADAVCDAVILAALLRRPRIARIGRRDHGSQL